MIIHLEINQLRNLAAIKIPDISPKFNILYGKNGSGKTSFLEAIHILSTGKSFRTHLINRIIQHNTDNLFVFAQVNKQDSNQTIPIGIQRYRNGDNQIRIANESFSSYVTTAQLLPLLVIKPDGHRLLAGAPQYRRHFIDWGLFHMEHTFYNHWQRAYRALKQRNAALKMHAKTSEITLWDYELIPAAEALNQQRQEYTQKLIPKFTSIINTLLDNMEFHLSYHAGWSQEQSLSEVLQQSLLSDMRVGHTQQGPHRADLLIRINKTPASDALSQGQQKLVIYALRLAQGMLLQELTGKICTYLIDDLPAELDAEKRQKVVTILNELNAQVFITSTEKQQLSSLASLRDTQSFEINEGKLKS